MEENNMFALLSYIGGILICTLIALALTSKEEAWQDTIGRTALSNGLYTIVFLILYALGFFN